MEKFEKTVLDENVVVAKSLEYYFPEFDLRVRARIYKDETGCIGNLSHYYKPSEGAGIYYPGLSGHTVAEVEGAIDYYLYNFTNKYDVDEKSGW